jgi:mRNA interferase RelE/StbE
MTYKLKFHPDALKEFKALQPSNRGYFRNKLKERLENPHIASGKLSGGSNLYKIKRKRPPLRLTYHADKKNFIVTAISVGMRDGKVYKKMIRRLG